MGHSNTIEQQTQLNAAFQTYIDSQTAAMQTTVTNCTKELSDLVTKTFADSHITDQVLLVGGQYQHLQTMSEWSLDNVIKIISGVKAAILGGPVPAGSKGGDPANLKAAATSLAGMEAVIADAAVSAVEGLLSGLKSATSTDLMKNTTYKQVTEGLYLFMTVVQYQYSRSDFLNNNTIDETIYVYQSYASAQGLAKVAAMGVTAALTKTYADVVASDAAAVQQALDAVKALPMDKNFVNSYTTFHNIIDMLEKDMQANKQKLDALTTGAMVKARAALAARRRLAA